MIAVDANIAIALADPGDAHSARAAAIMRGDPERQMHPVTLAEILVGPARVGLMEEVHDLITRGFQTRIPAADPEQPLRVAHLRARTGLKLPDCYPLDLALESGATLATFDARLAAAAASLGVAVVSA